MKADPDRIERYREAKELQTYAWADQMVDIINDGLIEPNRAKVMLDGYKFLMASHNRKVYGASQQIEISQSISIVKAMEEAKGRVIEGLARRESEEGECSTSP